ncbi:alpha/beta hydrolase [Sphingomonas sp. MG17]|uniref:Alpha/beta hydrolase n=1 Tax=Sphingomonas tagetis TaxID=2949092 RepID=A0A9X2HLB2_9SPHN|nr:alpha/beta fold hydrolase [Sphingomonas tagetis]MCP3732242.1 alpha/beta hydrolase [Sphingomonas tagetis]
MGMTRKWILFVAGLLLMLGGALLARSIQSADGVRVTDVAINTGAGFDLRGLLYVPRSATTARRRPAVIFNHGFINSREIIAPFAIELSRRGFVVLLPDMPGHGYSGGIVGAADYGGPAALRYLRSLPFVDRGNIGLAGHSMGGRPAMAASVRAPSDYRSVMLVGSVPKYDGKPVQPRNLAIVFGRYEELAALMWQVPRGGDVGRSPALQAAFGAAGPVEAERLYGDLRTGTARRLYMVPSIHSYEHHQRDSVAAVVDWFQQTLEGEANALAPEDQRWQLKELGTALTLLGMFVLLMSALTLFLELLGAKAAAVANAASAPGRNRDWWLRTVLHTLLPAAAFIPLMSLGQAVGAGPMFPQLVHNQLLVWAMGTAVLTLPLRLFGPGASLLLGPQFVRQVAAAVLAVAVAYFALQVTYTSFGTDARLWMWSFKPLESSRAGIAIPYLTVWFAFFVLLAQPLAGHLGRGAGVARDIAVWACVMAGGFVLLAAINYAHMAITGTLVTSSVPLLSILTLQFSVILAGLGAICALAYRWTGSPIPGAAICALLVTWYVTVGTANHWAVGFETPVIPFAAAR